MIVARVVTGIFFAVAGGLTWQASRGYATQLWLVGVANRYPSAGVLHQLERSERRDALALRVTLPDFVWLVFSVGIVRVLTLPAHDR